MIFANALTRRTAALLLTTTMLLLSGCASTGNPRDPFEPVNRGIYEFNDAVDKAVLKPVAEAYRGVVPQFVRSSIRNFFDNIKDVANIVNNVLQGKFYSALDDFGRVALNTTFGIGGLFDFASEAGLPKNDEDFGQTLGRWGVPDGPYLVLPFLGPSNLRDALGKVVDWKTDAVSYVDPSRDRNILVGTRIVSRRADLLDASNLLETAALDPYEFVRDAYTQRRLNQVYDGNPPPDKEEDVPPPAPRSEKKTLPMAAKPVTGTTALPTRDPSARNESAPPDADKGPSAAPDTAPQRNAKVVRVWLSGAHR